MKTILPYIIVFVAGGFCGALIYMNVVKSDAPVEKVVKSSTTQTTTENKIIPGVPDTTSKRITKTANVKVKAEGTTEFADNNNDLSITKVKVGKINDSLEVKVEAKYPEKIITKTDTVYSTTTVESSQTNIQEVVKESEWQLAFGTEQYWNDSIDLYKYSEISFMKRVWFFYLKGYAGIHNKLNDALSNIKIHSKLEINIPLD